MKYYWQRARIEYGRYGYQTLACILTCSGDGTVLDSWVSSSGWFSEERYDASKVEGGVPPGCSRRIHCAKELVSWCARLILYLIGSCEMILVFDV